MFIDDIPQEWVGKEIGCYTTQDWVMGPHVGTLHVSHSIILIPTRLWSLIHPYLENQISN